MRKKTAGKHLGFKQRLRNLIKKLYRSLPLKVHFRHSTKVSFQRSLILLVLLFFVFLAVPFFTPQVSVSSPIVQNQQNTAQLLEQGRKLYQARQFEDAAIVWQRLADAFATRGDILNQVMAMSNLSLTEQQLGKWHEAKIAIAICSPMRKDSI